MAPSREEEALSSLCEDMVDRVEDTGLDAADTVMSWNLSGTFGHFYRCLMRRSEGLWRCSCPTYRNFGMTMMTLAGVAYAVRAAVPRGNPAFHSFSSNVGHGKQLHLRVRPSCALQHRAPRRGPLLCRGVRP